MIELDYTGSKQFVPLAGGQIEFLQDWNNRYCALEGGQGAGKTVAGSGKLITLHSYNALDENQQPTYVKSAVIAPTYRDLHDYCKPQLEEDMEACGYSFKYKSTDSEFIMTDFGMRNKQSKILLRSADKPERIAGFEIGAGWGDEVARWKVNRIDPKFDPYIQFLGRLRAPKARFQQLNLTYTNEGDMTRVYKEFRAGEPSHALYTARTVDNPAVREFYDEMRRKLPSWMAAQYLDGGAISLAGAMAYPQFDRRMHIDDTLELDRNLPLHLILDFNIRPGMHALIGQHFPNEELFTVVHEIHAPRLDVRGTVQRFRLLVDELGGFVWPDLHVFGDATGTSGWAGTGESCYQILRQGLDGLKYPDGKPISYRIRVPKSNPLVADRLNAFNVALYSMDSRIHWKCRSSCTRLIKDLEELRRGNDGGLDKSEDNMSHSSDAEGYRIEYLRPVRAERKDTVGGRHSVTVIRR